MVGCLYQGTLKGENGHRSPGHQNIVLGMYESRQAGENWAGGAAEELGTGVAAVTGAAEAEGAGRNVILCSICPLSWVRLVVKPGY